MSWQGNGCFVFGIEYTTGEWDGRLLDATSELLHLYDEHGKGWYLLGNMYDRSEEDDYDSFAPTGVPRGCFCWLPNPFMKPGIYAIEIRCAHDLMDAAFECVDDCFDTIAYAGDGDEPLQHMVVWGREYDMREDWFEKYMVDNGWFDKKGEEV